MCQSILLLMRCALYVFVWFFSFTFDFIYHEPLINIHLFWILDWLWNLRFATFLLCHWYTIYINLCEICVTLAGWIKWEKGVRCFEMMLCCLFHLISFRTSLCVYVSVCIGEWIRHLAFGCALLCADLNKLNVIEFNLTSAICCDSAVAATASSNMFRVWEFMCLYIDYFFSVSLFLHLSISLFSSR